MKRYTLGRGLITLFLIGFHRTRAFPAAHAAIRHF